MLPHSRNREPYKGSYNIQYALVERVLMQGICITGAKTGDAHSARLATAEELH